MSTVSGVQLIKGLDNHAYGKPIWKSDYENKDQTKNAVDGDIFIYQRRLTCMKIKPGKGGIWLKIYTGFLSFDVVIVIFNHGCCSTYMVSPVFGIL